MSLLDASMEPFVRMIKSSVKDRVGGTKTNWVEAEGFLAAAVQLETRQEQTGSVEKPIAQYTITTKRAVTLKYHDVFKRVSDGKAFRSITNGRDKATPPVATLDMRQVKAEEYDLVN